MVFSWRCEPPLQIFEQLVHAVQSLNVQSASQDCKLHPTDSSVASQGSPAFSISTFTFRARSFTPPPHSALHALKPDHSSSTQSTGHLKVLHSCSICIGGHSIPPFGLCSLERFMSCMPPPQVAEHSCGDQSVTSQSANSASLPAILYNSPRIFSNAQSSVLNSFWVLQCSAISAVYSFCCSSNCLLFSPDWDSDSTWSLVEVARFVCCSRRDSLNDPT
mmetsp:Transcript_65519/g.213337  ORF Transcript_65519/g.213337 Transcript_65519/m.213337 type:complete len:219 (+) Transcript_65519:951-1607(+)